MEKRIYEYKIGTERMDFLRRATIKSMFDCVLDAAGLDAERYGFGVKKMVNELQATWVLIRMGMNISSLPQENEIVRVRTWVSEITSISSTRNFEVLNEQDEVIAAAVSLWTVIDINTRRMFPVNRITAYADMAQPEYGVPVEMPMRLSHFEAECSSSRKVYYSDVDYNRHAHSTNYLQWALDSLDVEELTTDRPVRVDVNFLRETVLGDEVTLGRGGSNPYLFEISANGEASCRLRIGWDA